MTLSLVGSSFALHLPMRCRTGPRPELFTVLLRSVFPIFDTCVRRRCVPLEPRVQSIGCACDRSSCLQPTVTHE